MNPLDEMRTAPSADGASRPDGDLHQRVAAWLAQARRRLAQGVLGAADLEELARQLGQHVAPPTAPRPRQRLLYLHADTPGIHSRVLAMARHEPVPGHRVALQPDPAAPGNWPYATVHDALIDGWRIVQFPDQRAPFDDGEIDALGYEFILEKWEPLDG